MSLQTQSTIRTRIRNQYFNITSLLISYFVLEWYMTTGASQPTSNSDRSGCVTIHLDENWLPVAPNSSQGLPISTQGNLSLVTQSNSPVNPASFGIECLGITAEQLHDQFNQLRSSSPSKVFSLVVRDSNLTNLSNLPQGTHELRRMIISNTSIDLEVLREGSESLDQLMTLEIKNERISNIPQNFFQEMQSLKELRMVNDEIASLDGNAFHNLDDSLEVLDLRGNRFNRFPIAVKNLAQLAVLDLTDNDIVIDTQENDLPDKLEPLLNLRELLMNRINCTCEFGTSPFFEWIAKFHISGVRCFAPEKLRSQEVIAFERDEFCGRSAGAGTSLNLMYSSNPLLLLTLFHTIIALVLHLT